jgi:hypothetical protein
VFVLHAPNLSASATTVLRNSAQGSDGGALELAAGAVAADDGAATEAAADPALDARSVAAGRSVVALGVGSHASGSNRTKLPTPKSQVGTDWSRRSRNSGMADLES